MNKLFSTIAIVTLASLALSGAASAKPGGNIGQMGGMGGGAQINVGGMGGGGGGAAGGYSGGAIDSPGDAFYPDLGSVGDPRQDCLEAGGRPVRQHGADIEWGCVL